MRFNYILIALLGFITLYLIIKNPIREGAIDKEEDNNNEISEAAPPGFPLTIEDISQWGEATAAIKGSQGIHRNALTHSPITNHKIQKWKNTTQRESMVGNKDQFEANVDYSTLQNHSINGLINNSLRKRIEQKSGGTTDIHINIDNKQHITGVGNKGIPSKTSIQQSAAVDSYTHPIASKHPFASPAMFGNTSLELEKYKCHQ